EYLEIPHIANVLKIIETTDKDVTLEMDMPDTVELVKVKFPCLLSVEKDIFQPRLPSFKKKVETKDREIKIICLNDMEDKDEKRYGLSGSPTQVERIFPPDENVDKEIWEGSGEELADRLSEKLKELKFI
ncbi:MAG: electron transfer flavoprotein subunit beta, partial [Actinobacteria bacterium]|nr:electron transfer flavoprotein subunit beta [Actinomycetota bacterium]